MSRFLFFTNIAHAQQGSIPFIQPFFVTPFPTQCHSVIWSLSPGGLRAQGTHYGSRNANKPATHVFGAREEIEL